MTPPSRTILAVNPSYQTDIESEFWQNFANAASMAGWSFIQLAARAIPAVANAETIVLPTTLKAFASVQHAMPRRELGQRPAWLSGTVLDRHVEWEHRRFQIPRLDPAVIEGALRLAWLADHAIRLLQPSIVLTTNKIDHPCAFFRDAALRHGAVAGLVERSPLDTIWYEPDGLFAESRLWTEAKTATPGRIERRHRKRLVRNPAGFRRSEASDDRPDLARLPRPVVFLPFDNLLWTGWGQVGHVQGSIDNPVLATPQDAIDQLSMWLARYGGSLVMKSHPSCHETAKLDLPANTYLVEGAIDHLIDMADLVVAFNTKLAFVALARGRTTVTLADNPAAATGLTVHWRDHPSVDDALDAGLLQGPGLGSAKPVDEYFTWLAESRFYGSSDGSTRPPAQLLADLLAEHDLDPVSTPLGAVEQVRALAGGDPGAVPSLRPHPVLRTRPTRGRLFLDASRLADPDSVNSGIARYGREILGRLEARADHEVWAVVREQSRRFSLGSAPLLRDLMTVTKGKVLTVALGSPLGSVAELNELGPNDIYHSIHLPLPAKTETGPARRIVTVHDLLHLKHPEFHPGNSSPTIKRVIDSIDVSSDFVVCDSEQTRRDLLQLVPIAAERTATVLLGTTRPVLHEPTRADAVVAMLQGETRKNARHVVTAVARTLTEEDHRRVRFKAIVSAGSLPDLEEWLHAAGMPKGRVDLLIDPDDDDVAKTLRRSRAFVFGSSYEGFGLPVLEAMAEGCPVVTPFNSSLVEVAGDAAAYALSENPVDIADALRTVLSDCELAAELERCGRQRARLLSWEHSVMQLIRIYNSVGAVPDGH